MHWQVVLTLMMWRD